MLLDDDNRAPFTSHSSSSIENFKRTFVAELDSQRDKIKKIMKKTVKRQRILGKQKLNRRQQILVNFTVTGRLRRFFFYMVCRPMAAGIFVPGLSDDALQLASSQSVQYIHQLLRLMCKYNRTYLTIK